MIKKVAFFALFAILTTFGFASNGIDSVRPTVNEGDVLVVKAPASIEFQHINFPKRNFILKRGGNPNYNAINGSSVVVKEVNVKEDGTTEVVLVPKNGGKFYNVYPSVKANLTKAVDAGELSY